MLVESIESLSQLILILNVGILIVAAQYRLGDKMEIFLLRHLTELHGEGATFQHVKSEVIDSETAYILSYTRGLTNI